MVDTLVTADTVLQFTRFPLDLLLDSREEFGSNSMCRFLERENVWPALSPISHSQLPALSGMTEPPVLHFLGWAGLFTMPGRELAPSHAPTWKKLCPRGLHKYFVAFYTLLVRCVCSYL